MRIKGFVDCWSVQRLSYVACRHCNSLYRGRFYVWVPDYVRYIEEFAKSRFVISMFYSMHFTVILTGRWIFVRYIADFVEWRFVKSRFHCNLACHFSSSDSPSRIRRHVTTRGPGDSGQNEGNVKTSHAYFSGHRHLTKINREVLYLELLQVIPTIPG